MKRILLILLICIIAQTLLGQTGVERPLQLQLNLQGPFMKAFGETLSNQEIESFDVENWAIPGLQVGYHLTSHWYLGYSFQPSRNQTIVEPWGFSEQQLDAHIRVAYETGHMHSLDLRFSPFKNGLYIQGSFMHISEAYYQLDANPIDEELQIGNGLYQTGMTADWNFKQVNTLALGLGYNHVTRSGLSFGVGIMVPFINDPYQDIRFTPTNEMVEIDPQDLQLAEQRLKDETFYYPVQINLTVGFNLNYVR